MPERIEWPQEHPTVTLYSERVHIADAARSENWQIDAILDTMFEDAQKHIAQDRPIRLVVVPSAPHFDAQAFSYAKWRDRLYLDVALITGIVDVDSAEVLEDGDYVVTKSGAQGWEFAIQDAEEITAQLLDVDSPLRADYQLLAEFPLPDTSTAQLFRHLHTTKVD
jgi:hypothetical protein